MRAKTILERARGNRILALLLLPMLVLAARGPALGTPASRWLAPLQQPTLQQRPTFGARISRVRVDAIVTDSDGRFVLDLQPADFRLREDGEPQEILSVQLVDMSAGTVTTMSLGPATAKVEFGGAADAAAAEVSVAPDNLGALIFVIDGPSLDPRGKRRFANAWIELLDQTDSLEIPRAAFMIDAVGNLEQLTPLGFDVEALQGAADAVLETPTFGASIHTRLRRLQQDMQNDFDPSNLVRAEEHDELVRSLNTFDLLTRFCDALASRPGRTALVWVSSGVKLMEGGPFSVLASRDTFEQFIPDRRIRAAQRDLHQAANSANVSIYSLDPTLKSDEDQFGFSVETATMADANQLRSYDMQAALDGLRDSMRIAAAETGGRSFIYNADLGRALATIREDSLRYYLLTYAAPRDQGDGEYHEIDVRVSRDGLRVRARQGYVDWPAAERRSRTLSAALAFPGTVSGPPIQAKAFRRFGPTGEPVTQIVAVVERPVERAGADGVPDTPGVDPGLLEFYTVVLRGGDVVGEFRQTVRSLGVASAATSGSEQFVYVHDLDLEPGNYELRLAAQGTADGELGATRLEFEVRERAEGWQASDLLLLAGDDARQIRPLVTDSIEAGEVLTAYVEVSGGRAPTLAGWVFQADGTTPLAQAPRVPMQADDSPIRKGTLRLRGLGVGNYVVHVEVFDTPAGESATFRVPIVVTDHSIMRVAAENLFGPGTSSAPIAPRRGAAQLLRRLDRLAGIYQADTLSFTARETIIETTHVYSAAAEQVAARANFRRVTEFEYVHGQGDAVPGEATNGFRRQLGPPAAAADVTAVAAVAKILDGFELNELLSDAYSWPALFSAPSGQPTYRYELAGRDTALGRPALLLAFRPATETPSDTREWFGTAWIDAETFQILRVHALARADYAEKVRFVSALTNSETGGDFVFTEITTDFWEEMNGLRFPGQVTIVRNRYRVTPNAIQPYETLPLVEVTQTYIDYHFLAIPSQEEIHRLIFGAAR